MRFILGSVTVWIIIIVACAFIWGNIPDATSKNPDCNSNQGCVLEKLKIFNANGSKYAEWDREKAIEFGLEKLDTNINYLFIAVAAVFAFMGKIVIDPKLKNENAVNLSSWMKFWIANSAIACVFSVFFGFLARMYFNNIGDIERFSIYNEMGFLVLLQLFLFGLAFLFLAIATILILTDKNS